MIKILANDGIHPDGKLLLEEAGYQVDTDKIPQDELSKRLPEYDVVIVRSATKIRKELIELCPNLKVIARGGVGIDNIDHEFARERGIAVYNTASASSQSVAELVIAHMFSLTRFLHQSNKDLPGGDFKKLKKAYSNGIELRGRSIAIIGFGRIGQAVARMAMGLGMRILPVDLVFDELKVDVSLYNMGDAAISVTCKTVEMEEAIRQADFITVHVPFAGGTSLIGKEQIAKMKDGVYLINTARGGVINEDALLEALNSGKVAGAGLDVFENEPNPREDLLNHPNVSVTPHTGASTLEAQRRIGLELADRIIAFFED